MTNRYLLLRLKILLTAIRRRQITFRKLLNALQCYLDYKFKRTTSGRFPFLINFELWNECNMNCLFCRSPDGDIYDYNPKGDGTPIPKGQMPFAMYTDIIEQAKDHLLMAVLYIGGEPLLYKDIFNAIKFASDRRIPTMIATNGMLLTDANCRKLLAAGLDFMKVAISGFTQDVYKIQHRQGNIDRIKEHLQTLARLNREGNHGLIIMVDYIFYRYNAHELAAAREFCQREGMMFNVRPGILKGLEEIEPAPPTPKPGPLAALCDWPWKVLTVNWNGDIFPCCDYTTWSGSAPYTRYQIGDRIADLWNGPRVTAYRQLHVTHGRTKVPVCVDCQRLGTTFKT